MKKPDGLTIIRPDEVSQVIEPLPIKDLCGVGSRMENKLNLLGIRTIGDLGKFPVDILDTVELQQPVRLLGVRLTNLKYNDAQLPLFPQERRKALMVRAMDAVNNRYGDDTATLAPATSRMLSSPSTNNIFSLCTGETAAPIEKNNDISILRNFNSQINNNKYSTSFP
jgi:nucleotidyltransferase/DNA polymerase involved in DNA repair